MTKAIHQLMNLYFWMKVMTKQ